MLMHSPPTALPAHALALSLSAVCSAHTHNLILIDCIVWAKAAGSSSTRPHPPCRFEEYLQSDNLQAPHNIYYVEEKSASLTGGHVSIGARANWSSCAKGPANTRMRNLPTSPCGRKVVRESHAQAEGCTPAVYLDSFSLSLSLC